jgi:glucose-1-phosphate cytidylyltransferase
MNETHENSSKLWKISLTDTGDSTMTGGRVKRIQIYIENERFMLTYGDGVSNADIKKVIRFHEKSGALLALLPLHNR